MMDFFLNNWAGTGLLLLVPRNNVDKQCESARWNESQSVLRESRDQHLIYSANTSGAIDPTEVKISVRSYFMQPAGIEMLAWGSIFCRKLHALYTLYEDVLCSFAKIMMIGPRQQMPELLVLVLRPSLKRADAKMIPSCLCCDTRCNALLLFSFVAC